MFPERCQLRHSDLQTAQCLPVQRVEHVCGAVLCQAPAMGAAWLHPAKYRRHGLLRYGADYSAGKAISGLIEIQALNENALRQSARIVQSSQEAMRGGGE